MILNNKLFRLMVITALLSATGTNNSHCKKKHKHKQQPGSTTGATGSTTGASGANELITVTIKNDDYYADCGNNVLNIYKTQPNKDALLLASLSAKESKQITLESDAYNLEFRSTISDARTLLIERSQLSNNCFIYCKTRLSPYQRMGTDPRTGDTIAIPVTEIIATISQPPVP